MSVMFSSMGLMIFVAYHREVREYRQDSLLITEVNTQEVVFSKMGDSPGTNTHPSTSGNASKPQVISGVGSLTPNPSWDTKFTPLTSSNISIPWSTAPGWTVPYGQTHKLAIAPLWSYGTQRFRLFVDNNSTSSTVARSRNWYTDQGGIEWNE